MSRIFLLFLMLIPIFSWASSTNIPTGTWQPSYAFLGKMAWNKSYLIITNDTVTIETSGVVKESFNYEVIEESAIPAIKLSNLKVWKFKINPKFGCKPKSKLFYDKKCTGQAQRNKFKLLQCETIESPIFSCSILDSYFSFEKRELMSLRDISDNL